MQFLYLKLKLYPMIFLSKGFFDLFLFIKILVFASSLLSFSIFVGEISGGGANFPEKKLNVYVNLNLTFTCSIFKM